MITGRYGTGKTCENRCLKREGEYGTGYQCELESAHEGGCACPKAFAEWEKRRGIT